MRWVSVGVLLLLAGCTGYLGPLSDAPATGGAGATATVTPAPLPPSEDGSESPTAAVDAAALPPGLGEAGVVNHTALRRAHRAALANRSVTVVRTVRATNGSDRRWARRTTLARTADGRFRYAVRSFGTPGRLVPGAAYNQNATLYGDVTGLYSRFRDVETGEWTTRRVPSAGAPTPPTAGGDWVVPFLPPVVDDVSRVERDGRTFYRVSARTDGPLTVPFVLAPAGPSDAFVRGYTVTALVRADGFVRGVAVAYDREATGGTYRVRVRYRDLGATNVTEPAWAGASHRRNVTAQGA